jgi:hypothetical protein
MPRLLAHPETTRATLGIAAMKGVQSQKCSYGLVKAQGHVIRPSCDFDHPGTPLSKGNKEQAQEAWPTINGRKSL